MGNIKLPLSAMSMNAALPNILMLSRSITAVTK
jgi:hypothetical protein